MYPRDWISGTRTLSLAARGVYIDIIVTIYDKGGPIDYDMRWLLRLFGLRERRQLQPLLDELIAEEKIVIKDGKIFQARAIAEIGKAQKYIADGKLGGRPPKPPTTENIENIPHEIGIRSASDRDLIANCSRTAGGGSEGKQSLSRNPPSPSPSPSSLSKKKEGADAPAGGKEKEQGNGPEQDPVKALFDIGVSLLTDAGVREKQARSLVGRWRGKIGDEALAGILVTANRATEPVAYIEKAIQKKLQPGCETFI